MKEQFLHLFDALTTPAEKALIGLLGIRHQTTGTMSHPLQDEALVSAISSGLIWPDDVLPTIRERLCRP